MLAHHGAVIMSQRLALSKIAALSGALALSAAAVVGAPTPAAAMFHFHGGGSHMFHGGGPNMFHSGGPHMAFDGFHHRFHHNRFFAGFAFAPGYDFGDYDAYDQCLQRVWGPYGWRWTNVCN
jgi:hypothetical protein